MAFKIDARSRTPIYTQLVQQVKHQVASGQLKPGDQLPTVRALAAELHIHTNTVARAYDLLDQDGVISAQQGRGTYIARQADHPQLRQHRHDALQAMIDRTVLEALSLGYSHQEIAASFDRTLKDWRRKSRKGTE
ncbi:MAG TPA: GntR family transcriptional regulator [Anaerolineae bacterium]|nr:GntR family transcriptional regulator [Anaerolineae bacterium]